jgi:translation initiation factor 4E
MGEGHYYSGNHLIFIYFHCLIKTKFPFSLIGSEGSKSKSKSIMEVSPGDHRLQSSYTLWFSRKPAGKQAQNNFEQNLKLIATFASCEQFWKIYSHLVRPDDLQSPADFHVFKEGIKPMWEDEANRFGGKWIVRLRKGLSSRCW